MRTGSYPQDSNEYERKTIILFFRNGNIRNFLAQKAAYVNHGEKVNINLIILDSRKVNRENRILPKLSHTLLHLQTFD